MTYWKSSSEIESPSEREHIMAQKHQTSIDPELGSNQGTVKTGDPARVANFRNSVHKYMKAWGGTAVTNLDDDDIVKIDLSAENPRLCLDITEEEPPHYNCRSCSYVSTCSPVKPLAVPQDVSPTNHVSNKKTPI